MSFARFLLFLGLANACADLTPPRPELGSDDVEKGGSTGSSLRGGSTGKKSTAGAGSGGTTSSAGRASTVTGGRPPAGTGSSGAVATNNGGRASAVSGGAAGSGGKVSASTGGTTPTIAGGPAKDSMPGGSAGFGGASERSRPKPPFFSEYVEGSGSYKALELAIAEPGRLEGCAIRIYANGSLTASRTIALTGVLTPETPLVICSSQLAALGGVTCDLNESLPFNGNDVVLLVCDEDVVDAFGQLGNDPGNAGWGSAPLRTQDQTLRRACTITEGDREPNDPFDLAANGWLSAGTDVFDGLGLRCEPHDDDPDDPGVGGAGGTPGTGAAGASSGGKPTDDAGDASDDAQAGVAGQLR
ncbi:MAG TPA: hypothetical protein VG937_29520 [Polyangiaceae bacterium]|nr:hypothetical protein [Polyangiaceae bacterium]